MPVEPIGVILICISGAGLSCYKIDEVSFIIIKLIKFLWSEEGT